MQEPALSFHHAALKAEWARMAIHRFQQAVEKWITGCEYSVSLKQNADGAGYALVVGVELPPWIPLWAGDICNNLRASLDYAWMGLVRAADPAMNKKKTLPIGANKKDLLAKIQNSPIGSAVDQASFLLTEIIGSHRDFENGGSQFLSSLNDLSNWNKHNLLIAGYTVTELSNVQIGNVKIGKLVNSGKGNVINMPFAVAEPEFTYDGKAAIQVIFGQGDFTKGECILPTLVIFHERCLHVLKAFCEAFPSPHNPAL